MNPDSAGYPGGPKVPGVGRSRLHGWLTAQLILLAAQLVSGIVANVAVHPVVEHPGQGPLHYLLGLATQVPWALTHGGPLLGIHTALGAAMWLVGAVLLVGALKGRRGPVTIWLVVAQVGLTGAGLAGGSLVTYGSASNSFLMTVGWMVALVGALAAWASGPSLSGRANPGLGKS